MKVTRRNFVKSIGTVAAISIGAGGSLEALGAVASSSLGSHAGGGIFTLNAKQFRGLVGRTFVVNSANGEKTDLVLTDVNAIERKLNTKRGYSGECYSVVFKRKGGEPITQDVYEIRAAGVAPFSALLVPTGRRQNHYEMIVNRISR